MYDFKTFITTLVLILSIISCNAQTSLSRLSFKEGKTTIIKNVIDMKGEELVLPKEVTLKFEKGGCLKNGKITAANTSIAGYKQGVFDGVKIAGEWNVRYISTDMFKDISSVNSLQNVFALASEKVDNVITIPEDTYVVATSSNGTTILQVPSNTEVIINGTIIMEPNALASYNIVGLYGKNITLHGNGEIIGDKHTHIGKTGEWGMGVMIAGCTNVDVYDITIKDCWGDCIYIGENSTYVRINNCTLDHGRRQGISITSAGDVLIRNCTISNVGGTSPEYAIDIEPNKNDTVESVIIQNVKALDCKGGFLAWSGASNALIKNVELYDCYVKGVVENEYAFYMANSIKIVNCTSEKNTKPINSKCKSFKVVE